MISEQILTTLIVSFVLIIAFAVGIFFMPALIELKRPKDAGPRVISDRLSDTKAALDSNDWDSIPLEA